MSWRFNMIPYGKDNEATKTFPTPKHEQPLKALAVNFTYNNTADWGDHIERKDNKPAVLRPVRHLATDIYIPAAH